MIIIITIVIIIIIITIITLVFRLGTPIERRRLRVF